MFAVSWRRCLHRGQDGNKITQKDPQSRRADDEPGHCRNNDSGSCRIGVITWQLIFGGSQEAQNAIDAGNLNVAYTALREPSVALEDLAGQNIDCREFNGVAVNSGGKHYICLRNANRMWGQVLLSALNVHMMNGVP